MELIEYVMPKCISKGLQPCDISNMHAAFQIENIEEFRLWVEKHGYRFNAPAHAHHEEFMKGWAGTYFKGPRGQPGRPLRIGIKNLPAHLGFKD